MHCGPLSSGTSTLQSQAPVLHQLCANACMQLIMMFNVSMMHIQDTRDHSALITACRKRRKGSTKRRAVRSLEANQVLQPEEHHLTET